MRKALLTINAVLAAAVLATSFARAQEPDAASAIPDAIDSAIDVDAAHATERALEAQADVQPPKGASPQELAVFYHQRGNARRLLGRYEPGIADLREAMRLADPARTAGRGNWGDIWRIQVALGESLRLAGDLLGALDHWRSVVSQYQASNDLFFHHALLFQSEILTGLYMWPDLEKVLAAANETIVRLRQHVAENSLLPAERINAQYNGYAKAARGELGEALRLQRLQLYWAEREFEAFKNLPDRNDLRIGASAFGVARAQINLSARLSAVGRYGEAQAMARAALAGYAKYSGFGSVGVAGALGTLAQATFESGNTLLAERYVRLALLAHQRSGAAPHSLNLAGRRLQLASYLAMRGQWQEAIEVFDQRDAGMRSDPAQFKRRGSSNVDWVLALQRTGEAQRAEAMSRAILAYQVRTRAFGPWTLARARGVHAMSQTALGDTAAALKNFQQAVPVLMRRDSSMDPGTGTAQRSFWQRTILEGYLELLAQLQRAGGAPAPDAQAVKGPAGQKGAPAPFIIPNIAFRMADWARGSVVQSAIQASAARANLSDPALAELARREQDALNRVAALNQLLARLAAAPPAQRLEKVIGQIQAEIEALRGAHESLRAQIADRFPNYAELVDPSPPNIAEIRKLLSPREALVSLYVGDRETYVWSVTARAAPSFRVVTVTRAEIEADVARLRRTLDFGDGNLARLPAFDREAAHRLYERLLAPDEAVWGDATLLNVIPHGALAQLPFGVLLTQAPSAPSATQDYRDLPWLTKKLAIAQLPTASAFVALRRAAQPKSGRDAFAGFGDPLFGAMGQSGAARGALRSLTIAQPAEDPDAQLSAAAAGMDAQISAPLPALSQAFARLPSLPDTADELKQIAAVLRSDPRRDVYLGKMASESNVKTAKLDNRKVIVFATHGLAPGEVLGLDQPALALSNPALTGEKDEDGFLTLEEVLGLKLDADWVVLSACNTASADGRAAEAVSGLGRAFFYAGARSLLVSNWAVETSSARALTTELFRRQAEDPRLTRAEALRQSMLALMAKNAPGSFSYAHPAFWAPFSLVGDGGR